GGPRHQETMGDTIAQTRSENVSKLSNDPLLARGNTLRSGEDSLKLHELMALFTTLQQWVLDLETTKTTQATEIASLKRIVKKLERRNKSRTHGLKRLYRVGSSKRVESSEDEDGDEVIVESVDVVNTAEETRSVVEEVTVVIIPVSAAMLLKKQLMMVLQPEEEEEERLAREKAQQIKEVNIAWDDVQAKIDADYQLAQRLQAQEQEELTDKEKARLFVQFLEQRRKHFAAKRAEEKRNKP
ncbi:hypothetical protein Tco_0984699, partial [Tanacetum coccineum]